MSIDKFECVLSSDGDVNLPLMGFIRGYCQSGQETWSETVAALRRTGVQNQFLIIERKQGDRAGRVTVGAQLQEMRDYIHLLRERKIINRKVIWIGHSFGGAIADDLYCTYPRNTAGVIALAPAPTTTGWWIFINPSFWLRGGLISLPAVIWSVITGQSVRYPARMVRGLFAGKACPEKRFQAFLRTQQPDSAWLFPQVLFAYFLARSTILRLRPLGRVGRRLVIGFKQDALMLPAAQRWFAKRTTTKLVWANCSHCWWLSGGVDDVVSHIKDALVVMNAKPT